MTDSITLCHEFDEFDYESIDAERFADDHAPLIRHLHEACVYADRRWLGVLFFDEKKQQPVQFTWEANWPSWRVAQFFIDNLTHRLTQADCEKVGFTKQVG